ncbi:Transcription initiation factor TFIID subunit 10 [Micractinium conductrix]|uniref:Transcription initiation factor TFIID subunit 10 n=1 Tax=Micractinium conductrix TaxID=554055 RepID=A0A2P6V9V6_9CHLO|nr:Transcription initiation factor TFIID subunit 10 [Micractinium conductrix]|eukprot:PSC70841.1 Transcription initiation factor TFIID subunit 10 [Micractinium conductrix]
MAQTLPAGLKELLDELEDYAPVVPDEVTHHALRQSGYDCKDARTVRFISIAAQRFLAQVLEEAHNAHKLRQMAPAPKLKEAGYDPRDRRDLLTTEDLIKALDEYGVKVPRAPYYTTSTKPQ